MKNPLLSLNVVQTGFAEYLGVHINQTGKGLPRKAFMLVNNEDLAREQVKVRSHRIPHWLCMKKMVP